MKSFTLAFITGRKQDEWEWLRDSFLREIDRWGLVVSPDVIVVNPHYPYEQPLFIGSAPLGENQVKTRPKPNIWQGDYRVTKADWWANSNARNTAICLCKTDWICFFDDRCVLMPGYLDALEAAMDGGYAMAGAYEKRTGMTVENGAIRHGGIITGKDGREEHCQLNKLATPLPCGADWLFGANFALPLEWALECNGVPEIADGLGFEDVLFGCLIFNNGHPIKYDPRAKVVQDRTPELCGPVYRKEDKGRGKGPQEDEKAWKLLKMFKNSKQAKHTPGFTFDIRRVRKDVLEGKPFPKPPKVEYKDFYDGQPIKEFQ